jgi:uncharacterized protein YdhG (YjbR/CyaY superfamily)
MANTDYGSVDQYIATFPKDAQVVLQRVRGIIRKAVPDIEELISYQIAGYRVQGRAALYLAGWKGHFSLYPATDSLVAALGPALAPHQVSKGTLRFSLTEPVPEELIERIAQLRAAETAELAEAKAKTKARRASAKEAAATKASTKQASTKQASTKQASKKAAAKKTAKKAPAKTVAKTTPAKKTAPKKKTARKTTKR